MKEIIFVVHLPPIAKYHLAARWTQTEHTIVWRSNPNLSCRWQVAPLQSLCMRAHVGIFQQGKPTRQSIYQDTPWVFL